MAMEVRDSTLSSDAATRRGLVPDVLSSDRELAYVLWSTTHGQNAAEVARELGLPETTVRSWVTRDGWRARIDQEHLEQKPARPVGGGGCVAARRSRGDRPPA